MSPETGMEFFKRIKYLTDRGFEDSVKLRTSILNQLAKEGKMSTVFETERSHDQIVADYRKQGLNIDDRRIKNDPNKTSVQHTGTVMGRFFRKLAWVVDVLFHRDTKGSN